MNGFAARVRILEKTLAMATRPADSLNAQIIETSRMAHHMLDQLIGQHVHSLAGAIRVAKHSGVLPVALAVKLTRLSRAADAVRHITPVSLTALLEQLEEMSKPHEDDFDAFPLLHNMVEARETSVCGAQLVPGPIIPEEFEGQSILAAMLEQRQATVGMINEAKAAFVDKSWELCAGDIVYVNNDPKPRRVIRNGWGDYECEVRVARLHENLARWESGHWIRTDQCYKLEVNDRIVATDTVNAATTDEHVIMKGTECVFLGKDADGDVILRERWKNVVIFHDDLEHFDII